MSRGAFPKQLSCRPSAIALLFCPIVILSSPLFAVTTTKPSSANLTWGVARLSQPPTIDGRLDEWTNLSPLRLGTDPAHVKQYPRWAGPLDCSGRLWLGWDEEFFYFAADIEDDVFSQNQFDPSYIWSDDSIQIALDPKLDKKEGGYAEDDREFGLALYLGKTITYCWQGPNAPCEVPSITAVAAQKRGGAWVCEAAIPWAEIGMPPRADLAMGFSYRISDSDITEYQGLVELTPGMAEIGVAETKNTATFGIVKLLDAQQTVKFAENDTAADRKSYTASLSQLEALIAGSEDAAQVTHAQLWTGHTHVAYGEYEKAEQAYKKAFVEGRVDANTGPAVLALSQLFYEVGRFEESISLCESFLHADVEEISAKHAAALQLAELLKRRLGAASARVRLADVVAVCEDPSAAGLLRLAIASSYHSEADLHSAVEELRRALSAGIGNSSVGSLLADELYVVCNELLEIGETDLVVEVLTESTSSGQLQDFITADHLSLLVTAWFDRGEPSQAKMYMREMLTRFPAHHRTAEVRMHLAQESQQEGDAREAEQMLKSVLQWHPTLYEAGYAGVMLGDLYVEQGKYDAALKRYTSVAESSAFALETRAKAALGAGNVLGFHFRQYDKALRLYEDAQRLSPDSQIAGRAAVHSQILSAQR
ncbi:MAG: tetratricopeptide repeat protein [Armatimonadetes bacterium]|nr:tetratricopeptide repeat protein [Armatimonadota bacterium]NIM24477.1 tetratricopeptide repeat protein [Armatimonadota bacterium]NIM68348.1 tetratricopeptide repeat protein [Armatimonadota bacterium]NIM76752.1 tetratricopeptide repeat protein [Armatimonadota bacterium]NIN06551.1 tetratricopeptide repeat protein [Armatimonadota bacterium]